MALLAQATTLEMLEQAWAKVRGNRGGAGGDGVTIAAFAEQATANLLRLQRDLRQGTYAPGPVRRVAIAKKAGGTRILSIPSIADRVAQTAVHLVLGPLLEAEMEPASYGYRPGRSVRMAVDRVSALRRQGYGWVVDGDIERFFDTVPHEKLLARLDQLVPDAALVDIIGLWLDPMGQHGLGLPQGGPLSPLLANIYLDTVDEAIEGAGVRLVRFADDFLLLCRGRERAELALGRMAELLAAHGLRLNPDKTRIVPFEQGFRFLGHLFVRSVVLREQAEDEQQPRPAAIPHIDPPEAAETDPLETDPWGQPGLRVLYVYEPGRRLGARNQAFTVVEDGREIIAIPASRVDRIELGPAADAEPEALRLALAHDTALALVSASGATLGSLAPPPLDPAALHLEQARHCLDAGLRLDLARRMVLGRLRNQRALLRRLNRRRKDAAVDRAVVGLNRCLRRLPAVADLPELLGVEGLAAAFYWPALARMVEQPWRFRRRQRDPAPDPMNLLFNFLSALLRRDLEALIRRRGLHPGFGVLHVAQTGHAALASDLMEEFRAPLVEGLAVYLVNNHLLSADNFTRLPSLADGAAPAQPACHIDAAGRNAAIRAYESWLDRPIKSPRTGHTLAWRRLMEEQVLAFKAHIRGHAATPGGEPYHPYCMDY